MVSAPCASGAPRRRRQRPGTPRLVCRICAAPGQTRAGADGSADDSATTSPVESGSTGNPSLGPSEKPCTDADHRARRSLPRPGVASAPSDRLSTPMPLPMTVRPLAKRFGSMSWRHHLRWRRMPGGADGSRVAVGCAVTDACFSRGGSNGGVPAGSVWAGTTQDGDDSLNPAPPSSAAPTTVDDAITRCQSTASTSGPIQTGRPGHAGADGHHQHQLTGLHAAIATGLVKRDRQAR